jgi:hypothetical protein
VIGGHLLIALEVLETMNIETAADARHPRRSATQPDRLIPAMRTG